VKISDMFITIKSIRKRFYCRKMTDYEFQYKIPLGKIKRLKYNLMRKNKC
jgi:hypothetical protein